MPETQHNSAEKVFLEAYDTLSDAIFRQCYFRCFDRELARELTQECFMRTWEQLAGGADIKNVKAFLYRVAGNLVIDNARKKKAESLDVLAEVGFDPVGSGAAEVEASAEVAVALRHLDSVPEQYRQVVVLRYVEGMSPKEIAVLLEEKENAVSVRIHRGMAMLKEMVVG